MTFGKRNLTGIVAWVTLAILVVAAGAQQAAAQRIERSFNHGGLTRSYVAYLPSDLSSKSTWPVIMAFHPGFATSRYPERTMALHETAQARNFIIVYPDGYKRAWNVEYCCGISDDRGIDDIGFVQAIMADLRNVAPVEPKFYATGFSNGAMFTYYLLCKKSSLIAAAAPYGAVLDWQRVQCNPSEPVPILHIHGEDDPNAPFSGGTTEGNKAGYQQPVMQNLTYWGSAFRCSGSRQSSLIPNVPPCEVRTGCNEGVEVTLCAIPDLGHIWPGAEENVVTRRMGLGEARPDINGTQIVMDFFESQRR